VAFAIDNRATHKYNVNMNKTNSQVWLDDVLPCDFESLKNGGFDCFDADHVNENLEDVKRLRARYGLIS